MKKRRLVIALWRLFVLWVAVVSVVCGWCMCEFGRRCCVNLFFCFFF